MKPYFFPVVLALCFAAASSASGAEVIDLTLASKDSSAPETIYASQTAYSENSAKAAYVFQRVLGAYYSTVNDPNGRSAYEVSYAMNQAREEAQREMQGNSYRGGFLESLLKDSGENLTKYAARGAVSLGNTSNLIVEKSLDGLEAPGRNPPIGFSVVAGTNAYALGKMNENSPLGEELRKIGRDYFTDINPSHDLKFNPGVLRGRMEQRNREVFEAYGLRLDAIQGEVSRSRKRIEAGAKSNAEELRALGARLEGGVKAELAGVKNFMAEVERREKAAADRAALEEARRQLLQHADRAQRGFGVFAAAASMLGDKDAARFFSKGGDFVASGIKAYASIATFGTDPISSISSFMQTAMLGAGLFGAEGMDPQVAMHQEVMSELKDIKGMLATMGQLLDSRFDALDRNLRLYMQQTTSHLAQQDYFLLQNEGAMRSLGDNLARLRRETYGS
ncbi:MAG: hypothetical protein EOP11_21040, partial [Proteobacteria bacterium]